MTAIPAKSAIPNFNRPSDGISQGGGKLMHVIDGVIYLLGRGANTSEFAIWKSTDEGVSWVGGTWVASQTIVAGAGTIKNASFIPNGTDIYVVVHQSAAGGLAATSMYTFDTTNDTISVGAGTLPQTLQTDTSTGNAAVNNFGPNCCGVMVGSDLVVWSADVTTLAGRIQYGDPTVDTTWTVATPPAGSPGAMILNVAGTKVHCFNSRATNCFTYDPGVGFSTGRDFSTPADYDYYTSLTAEVAYVGNTGGVDYFVITGSDDGNLGFGAQPFYRRVQEDGSGDLSATFGSSVNLDGTDASVDKEHSVVVVADPVTAGKSYIFWSDGAASPDATFVSKVSTNYGSTYTTQTIQWDTSENTGVIAADGIVFTRGGGGVVGFIHASFPGPRYGEVLMLVVEATIQPTSDIVSARWESAPTASQTLFSQVDEVTPSDTDYIYVDLT